MGSADFAQVADACGLQVHDIELTDAAWRKLDAIAERTGLPYCEVVARGLDCLAQEMGGRAATRGDLPRPVQGGAAG
jgi:hypothetical protein